MEDGGLLEAPRKFLKESQHLLVRCTKPDQREFIKITRIVSTGFVIMGVIGYLIKLVHIPINNIIVGGV